jgi:hypothetical protein
VSRRAQHSEEPLAALRVVLEHEQVHRGHDLNLQPIPGPRQAEGS